ncbi:MAG: hypothetical protein RLZZ502_705, partial [Pseudomonadota bacterium]
MQSKLTILVTGLGCAGVLWAADPSLTVTEFYAPSNKRYFMTGFADESAALNANNNASGWYPTGVIFAAYVKNENTQSQPVYRFYSPTANTHFYTTNAAEAEGLRTDKVNWRDEGIAFYAANTVGGGCAEGTAPIFRSYNNGFSKKIASNHRYSPDLTLLQNHVKAQVETLEGFA